MKSLMELDLFKISNSSNKELQKKLTDVNMKRDKLDLSEIKEIFLLLKEGLSMLINQKHFKIL